MVLELLTVADLDQQAGERHTNPVHLAGQGQDDHADHSDTQGQLDIFSAALVRGGGLGAFEQDIQYDSYRRQQD